MHDLTKSDMKVKAKQEVVETLQKLIDSKENGYTNGVPMSQQDKYKEALAKEIDRVSYFLGF